MSRLRNCAFESGDFGCLVADFLLVAVKFELTQFVLDILKTLRLGIDECLSVCRLVGDNVTKSVAYGLTVSAVFVCDRIFEVGKSGAIFTTIMLSYRLFILYISRFHVSSDYIFTLHKR